MKKLISLTVSSLLYFNLLWGQELVTSAGDIFENENLVMEWSLGECVIETFSATNIMITQGFHQNNYIISSVFQESNLNGIISAYPNPVTSDINIYFEIDLNIRKIELYNVSGQKVLSETIPEKQVSTKINMTMFDSGVYMIKISDSNNKQLSIVKIVKY
ncbi:MAG: T9SS type A sorting domain-containing protein [Bacteroidales bacterium]|nr:T9SS type A sorting domain-containing protein [Bacteroidales bacterium]